MIKLSVQGNNCHGNAEKEQLLLERFKKVKEIGSGSFGQVFKVIDVNDTAKDLIAKIYSDQDQFDTEVEVLQKVKQHFEKEINLTFVEAGSQNKVVDRASL